MRKSFKLDEIDCAVCAGKLEDAIKKLDGVTDAKVNFLTQKLTLEAADEDFDDIFESVVKLTADLEADCEIVRSRTPPAAAPPLQGTPFYAGGTTDWRTNP